MRRSTPTAQLPPASPAPGAAAANSAASQPATAATSAAPATSTDRAMTKPKSKSKSAWALVFYDDSGRCTHKVDGVQCIYTLPPNAPPQAARKHLRQHNIATPEARPAIPGTALQFVRTWPAMSSWELFALWSTSSGISFAAACGLRNSRFAAQCRETLPPAAAAHVCLHQLPERHSLSQAANTATVKLREAALKLIPNCTIVYDSGTVNNTYLVLGAAIPTLGVCVTLAVVNKNNVPGKSFTAAVVTTI